MSRDQDRRFDIVLFGATGFVGRFTARYLAEHAPPDARIALAGRSAQRLASVRDTLGPVAAEWPLLLADSGDRSSLDALAAQARVVATTVGPYARYGTSLVAACARAGTDYADLTGELLFVRDTIDRFDAEASANGARLVHACGFDSIPSDIGTLLLAERARADNAGELEDTTLVVTSMRGGFSGGTIDSRRAELEAVRREPGLADVLADAYALSPDRDSEPELGEETDLAGVTCDPDLGGCIGPFVMAPFNTRIVRRSNALQGWSYGRRFHYREVMGYGTSPVHVARGAGTALGLKMLIEAMRFGPTRAVVDRVARKPGEGPSEESIRRGHFRMEIHARTSSGAEYVGVVASHLDPGYGATPLMLGEVSLCLALDGEELPARAGVLTPATAMGRRLAERLSAAGVELSIDRIAAPARESPGDGSTA
jgi:short subunit dehydrogenase-like uncharacterized protein